jgi:hypothetical protein
VDRGSGSSGRGDGNVDILENDMSFSAFLWGGVYWETRFGVVEGGNESVDAAGETGELEQVLVGEHEATTGISEGEEKTARGDVGCRSVLVRPADLWHFGAYILFVRQQRRRQWLS